MSFPWRDWQFWVVTAFFLLAAWYLLRGMLPPALRSRRSRERRLEHKATLTISAKRDKADAPKSDPGNKTDAGEKADSNN